MNVLRTLAFIFFGLGTAYSFQYAVGFFLDIEGNYNIQSFLGPALLFIACAFFSAYIWKRDVYDRNQTMKHLQHTMPESW